MTEHDSLHPATKDLTEDGPAPMDAELAGYPWLPRMIDKARASHAGTLGPYYRYPCPIDAACLDRLGITADTFREIAIGALEDENVIDMLVRIGARTDRLATFDPIHLNAEIHSDDS
jgi:uncharacterized protein DUF5069